VLVCKWQKLEGKAWKEASWQEKHHFFQVWQERPLSKQVSRQQQGGREEEMEVANLMLNGQGIVLVTVAPMIKMSKKMWIADMAVSTHITNEEQGLYNVKNVNELIKISSGANVYATKVGKLDISFVQENGCWVTFTLKKNVHYIPSFYVKVFSLMVVMLRGCKIISKNLTIIVRTDALKFEIRLPTM